MSIIQIQHLYKTFGTGENAVHALEDISLDLQGMDGVFTRSKGLVQVLNLNDRHGTTLLSGEFWQ